MGCKLRRGSCLIVSALLACTQAAREGTPKGSTTSLTTDVDRGGGGGSPDRMDDTGKDLAMGGTSSFPDVEFIFDPTLDQPRESCASEIISAKRLPLDIYIVLDKSGSMRTAQPTGDDCDVALGDEPVGDNKWCRVVSALDRRSV